MKYRLQAITDDGLVKSETDIDALHIPQGGDLVVRVGQDVLDVELHHISVQLREFFGDRHRVLVVHGNIEFLRLVEVPG